MVRTRSYFTVLTVLAAMALVGVMATSSGAAPGDTTRVSVASDGTEANGSSGANGYTSISANGRFVAFYSNASNLVPGDTNNVSDIFVHDRQTRTTERVSVGVSETEPNDFVQANSSSFFPTSISANGRFVAFTSEASNLVAGDTTFRDVFVRDRDTDGDEVFDEAGHVATLRVSTNSPGGIDPNGFPPSISADGRYVAFESSASEGVSDDTNGERDVFVRDLKPDPGQTRTIVRVSVDSSGNQADDGHSYDPSISADGRFVAFTSPASDLVEGDISSAFDSFDIFVHDRDADGDEDFDETDEAGAISTERVSVNHFFGGTPNDNSFRSSISADGRYVAFQSHASNLVPNDTNGCPAGFCDSTEFEHWYADVFVYDRDTETTKRVSVNNDGTQANGGTSEQASISADGRYVAFGSSASILADCGTNRGIFVRDRDTDDNGVFDEEGAASTQWLSRGGGTSISADGNVVAFESSASNLVAGDTNNVTDIFVHERQTATTQPDECIAPTSTASATTSSGSYEQGTWTNKGVQVTLRAQDNEGGSGIKEVTYSATGAQPIASTTVPVNQLPTQLHIINTEGTTTISYFATDNQGNREYPLNTFTVKLDKSAPDTTIFSGPSDYVSSTSASFHFASSSEPGFLVTFQCRRDGSAFAACPQTKTYSGLSQGNHTFEARAVDKAGNVDPSPASRRWFVDTVVPTGTISINGGASSTSSRSVTLSLSASDPSPASGVAYMRFRNGGTTTWSSWVAYTTSKSWRLTSGAGTKTVYVRYKDRAGNISATASDKIRFSP
jgi:hypothetical protein